MVQKGFSPWYKKFQDHIATLLVTKIYINFIKIFEIFLI